MSLRDIAKADFEREILDIEGLAVEVQIDGVSVTAIVVDGEIEKTDSQGIYMITGKHITFSSDHWDSFNPSLDIPKREVQFDGDLWTVEMVQTGMSVTIFISKNTA